MPGDYPSAEEKALEIVCSGASVIPTAPRSSQPRLTHTRPTRSTARPLVADGLLRINAPTRLFFGAPRFLVQCREAGGDPSESLRPGSIRFRDNATVRLVNLDRQMIRSCGNVAIFRSSIGSSRQRNDSRLSFDSRNGMIDLGFPNEARHL